MENHENGVQVTLSTEAAASIASCSEQYGEAVVSEKRVKKLISYLIGRFGGQEGELVHFSVGSRVGLRIDPYSALVKIKGQGMMSVELMLSPSLVGSGYVLVWSNPLLVVEEARVGHFGYEAEQSWLNMVLRFKLDLNSDTAIRIAGVKRAGKWSQIYFVRGEIDGRGFTCNVYRRYNSIKLRKLQLGELVLEWPAGHSDQELGKRIAEAARLSRQLRKLPGKLVVVEVHSITAERNRQQYLLTCTMGSEKVYLLATVTPRSVKIRQVTADIAKAKYGAVIED